MVTITLTDPVAILVAVALKAQRDQFAKLAETGGSPTSRATFSRIADEYAEALQQVRAAYANVEIAA